MGRKLDPKKVADFLIKKSTADAKAKEQRLQRLVAPRATAGAKKSPGFSKKDLT